MTIDYTPPGYFVLHAQLKELRRAIELPEGMHERHLQTYVLRHAHLLSHVPEHAEFSISRIDAPASRNRPDLVAAFFGAASFDVIELKRPDVDLQGVTARKEIEDGVNQLIRYDQAIAQLGGVRIGRMTLSAPTPPRLLLVIGRSSPADGTPVDLQRVQEDVRVCCRGRVLPSQRLELWTWDAIADALATDVEKVRAHATRDRTNSDDWRSHHAASRRLLGRLVDRQTSKREQVDTAKLLKDASTPTIAQALMPEAVVAPDEVERVTALTVCYAELVASLAGTATLTLNEHHAAMELASIVLYERDGDLPYRFWEHAGTWGTVEFLKELPGRVSNPKVRRTLLGRISAGMGKVITLDTSEACIGACAHIGRTFRFVDLGLPPEELLDCLNGTRARARWAQMEELLAAAAVSGPAAYSWFVPATHVAYLRTTLGDRSATELLNACAANAESVQRITAYNAAHSYRNPARLQDGLRMKASNPLPFLDALVPWHGALSTAFAPVAESLHATPPTTEPA